MNQILQVDPAIVISNEKVANAKEYIYVHS